MASLAYFRCFPHIVNLACKAVLAAITDLKYADNDTEVEEEYMPTTFGKDCIAAVCSFVNAVFIWYFHVFHSIDIA